MPPVLPVFESSPAPSCSDWLSCRRSQGRPKVDLRAVAMLFAYMIFFSFAYLSLSAGTGALILFGAVQVTMFVVGLRGGEHFSKPSWVGLSLAVAGLVYLVSPGVTAPNPAGALLMAIAGVTWGFYSLSLAVAGLVYLVSPGVTAPNPAGVLLLGEEVNLRLVLASVATLGGIATVLRSSQTD